MGLFRTIADIFTTTKVMDEFGIGAGLLYSDVSSKFQENGDLDDNKESFINMMNSFLVESRKYMGQFMIDKLHYFVKEISNSNKMTFNVFLTNFKNIFTIMSILRFS